MPYSIYRIAAYCHLYRFTSIIIALLLTFFAFKTYADKNASTDLKHQYFLNKMQDKKLPVMTRVKYIDSLDKISPTSSWQYLKQKAHLYRQATNFNEALSCYKALSGRKDIPLVRRLQALYWTAWSYNTTSQYSKALNTALTILAFPKPDSLWYMDSYAYLLVYNTYDLLRNYDMCSRYLQRIETELKKHPEGKEAADLYETVMLYKAALFLSKKEYPQALAQCKKVEQMKLSSTSRMMADMNFAWLLEYMGEPAKAEEYYKQIMRANDEELIYNINYESAMFNYALLLLNQKRYRESEEICRRQIPNTFYTGQKNTRGLLYDVLGNSLKGQGRYKEAFDALYLSMATMDSVRHEKNTDFSEITTLFEERLAKLEKSRQSSGNEKLYWWLTAISLLVILATGIYYGLTIRRKHERKKQRRKQILRNFSDAEQRHCQRESETAKELDEANRKIVALSMKKTESEGLLVSIREITLESNSTPRDKIAKIKNLLQAMPVSERNWEVFRTHFEKVHPHFFTNLSRQHPDLTQGDLKMAAFIIMNISTKEIAALLCRSQRTVESARYRLHKKLNCEENISMAQYLRNFVQQ